MTFYLKQSITFQGCFFSMQSYSSMGQHFHIFSAKGRLQTKRGRGLYCGCSPDDYDLWHLQKINTYIHKHAYMYESVIFNYTLKKNMFHIADFNIWGWQVFQLFLVNCCHWLMNKNHTYMSTRNMLRCVV